MSNAQAAPSTDTHPKDRAMDTEAAPAVTFIPRERAIRQLAATILNDAHYLVASATPAIVSDTITRLTGITARHFLDDPRSPMEIVIADDPTGDAVLAAVREAARGLACISTISKTAVTAEQLAAALEVELSPIGTLEPVYRRPADRPDDTPPRLIREAWARLATHQGRRHR